MAPARISLYIDNSNIFRGCKKSGWRPSYRRVRNYLQELEGPITTVHFFASELDVPRDKQARFYRSLRGELGFLVHTYRLAHRKVNCPRCGHEEWVPTEKGVDVGLATQILCDLCNDAFDAALVMSSDRDYFDAIVQVRRAGRKVKVIAWKWTLPGDTINTYQENQIQLLFLEDIREQVEKPQGDVL
ncbi:MAG TPA: NYN domain-containing protein [bacterium]|nr:NYN domain-containing protein [bacterium]